MQFASGLLACHEHPEQRPVRFLIVCAVLWRAGCAFGESGERMFVNENVAFHRQPLDAAMISTVRVL